MAISCTWTQGPGVAMGRNPPTPTYSMHTPLPQRIDINTFSGFDIVQHVDNRFENYL